MSRLVIVTASTDVIRARSCLYSWQSMAAGVSPPIILVRNGKDATPLSHDIKHVTEIVAEDYLGSVPAFALGVAEALRLYPDAVIACLHDDLEIREFGWDMLVAQHFDQHPATGLAGFFGASGIGTEDIYKTPYNPYQLIRLGCRSNIDGAEAHGARSTVPSRVAVLDGFSLIGRARFFKGETFLGEQTVAPWQQLLSLGLVHHIYDGALGMLAARLGWDTYFLPIVCTHYGGRTAVADPGYNNWAAGQTPLGDQGFWNAGHQRVYDEFRDLLPLRRS